MTFEWVVGTQIKEEMYSIFKVEGENTHIFNKPLTEEDWIEFPTFLKY